MATVEECRQALDSVAAKIAEKSSGAPASFERSVSVIVPDLSTGFRAKLANGQLTDITQGEDEDAQITLTASSDDLVALASGRLNATAAWTNGKLKIDASFTDLMKLRTIL